LRVNQIKEIKSIPYCPTSHPFVERLIGTIRRGYWDNTPFIGPRDLENKLSELKAYYNENRMHQSLKSTSAQVAGISSNHVLDLDKFKWESHCRGLFQTPIVA
jgi:putative transposase